MRSSFNGPRPSEALNNSTADQRLLDSRGPAGWNHTDSWRIMKIQSEFIEAFDELAELGPAVTVFGSARTPVDSPYYELGEQVGAALAKAGFSVMTGGGPGVMEAVNKGAASVDGHSVGLGIELPFEAALNPHVTMGLTFRYFFVRKTAFIKYSQGYIVMPGGAGTLDELFEAMTLTQTGKINHFPIVLMGVKEWTGLIEWMRTTMLADGRISQSDLDMLVLTDDVDEAVALMVAARDGNWPEP